MTALFWIGLATSAVLLGMWIFALVNLFALPRLNNLPQRREGRKDSERSLRPSRLCGEDLPHISVLIPARDEAPVIQATVAALLAQDYPHFDLHILDDHSSDGTAALAAQIGRGDLRLSIHPGQELPPGWIGKNWACHQLAQVAQGEILLFTDADVQWRPGALGAMAAEFQRTQADLLTVWPTQVTESWGERLVVPLMALVVVGYLPIPLVHHTPWRIFAAANGQGMLFRPSAYAKVGGHAGVRANVLEDVTLARRVKGAGLRLRMVDGGGLIQCRMYEGWEQTVNGYAKNILAGYGNSVPGLILATLFHWTVFLGPWVWLATGSGNGWPWWPAGLIAAGIGLRAVTAAFTRQRVGDALLLPVSVLLMTVIAAKALWWRYRLGGPVWKGRVVGVKE